MKPLYKEPEILLCDPYAFKNIIVYKKTLNLAIFLMQNSGLRLPLGTNFSLRKATQPLPPSPAFRKTRAVSKYFISAGNFLAFCR